jgi:acyl carrier protein
MSDARAQVIADFVRASLLQDPSSEVAAETPLLKAGLIDSMGYVLLAAFVEERFGVRITDADLRSGELDSIGDLLAFLDRAR